MPTVTSRPPTRLDADGHPVWGFDPGTVVVPHVQAWELLGVGHRCETWLAWSARLWAPVVLKLARPHQVDHGRARQSLAREVAALADNPHPALPRLYADGTGGALPYVLSEYVDGPALDELRTFGWFPRRAVAHLGAQLLGALVPLHARGLAHLDVKPENILVRDRRPVLVDLGSARTFGSPQPPGHPVGTLGWAAPEMEACQPISAGMDLYGVGRVLQAALRPAFGWTRHHPLDTLVAALLRPDPASRPDLQTALDQIADVAGPQARPWPAWVSAPVRTQPGWPAEGGGRSRLARGGHSRGPHR